MTEGQQTTRFDWKVLLIGGSSAIGNTPRHVIGDTSVLFALVRLAVLGMLCRTRWDVRHR